MTGSVLAPVGSRTAERSFLEETTASVIASGAAVTRYLWLRQESLELESELESLCWLARQA